MPTSSPAASCRQRGGCPTSAKRVSHRREEKNRQVRKQGTRKRDSQNQGLASGRFPTIAPNGRHGYGAGANLSFGCHSGVQSPQSWAVSHRRHYCKRFPDSNKFTEHVSSKWGRKSILPANCQSELPLHLAAALWRERS